jgi:hypothetical protein
MAFYNYLNAHHYICTSNTLHQFQWTVLIYLLTILELPILLFYCLSCWQIPMELDLSERYLGNHLVISGKESDNCVIFRVTWLILRVYTFWDYPLLLIICPLQYVIIGNASSLWYIICWPNLSLKTKFVIQFSKYEMVK